MGKMSSHCSVCGIILPYDDLAYERIERHHIFHVKAEVQGRNTCSKPPVFRISFD